MNAVTSTILWMSVQIALFSLVGWLAFVLMRRRGPNTATMCAATVLGLTLPLAVLDISPWPRWIGKTEILNPKTESISKNEISGIQRGADTMPQAAAPASVTETEANPSVGTTLSTWWHTATDWLNSADHGAFAQDNSPRPWLVWLPWLMAMGVGIGLVRLAAGVWAVNRIRAASHIIHAPELLNSVDRIAAELKAPHVEVRECSMLRSAATIGWRRPLLLLPADWRSWTETERQIVLAHELAHVARRDYLTGLLANFVTAVHFYQPLVLWLGRQLRIQQELAADNQAAAVAGNRQTYLTTLAQMALRADDQPLPWAARAFLPGTSMLIKRVAWLKRKGPKVEKSLGRSGRWTLAICMALIALAVAGIRGPSGSGSPLMAQNTQNQPDQKGSGLTIHVEGEGTLTITGNSATGIGILSVAQQPPVPLHSFDFIPADTRFIATISPNEIFKLPSLAQFVPLLDEMDRQQNVLGFRSADMADVQIIQCQPGNRIDRAIFRYSKPFDWKAGLEKALHGAGFEIKQLAGKQYYVHQNSPPMGNASYVPDDRTLIVGTEAEIQKIVRGGEKLMTPVMFPALAISPIAVRIDMSLARQMGAADKTQLDFHPMLALFLPLIEQTKVVTLVGNAMATNIPSKDLAAVTITVECDSPDAAQTVSKTLEAGRTFALNALAAKKDSWRAATGTAELEGTDAMAEFAATINKALVDAEIHVEKDTVTAITNVDVAPPMVAAVVMPALAASREAARRNQSMSNLKQLALAMFNYEAKNGHFPPVAIRNTNGKPLLSWRVAILPYIEQQALYKEFHLDEPWDSEHNEALIAKMPALFRDPHEDEKSANSSYFMVMGKGMFGDNEKGRELKEITDGTSKTIMLVDASRDIPWTKPEDIEIDPDPTKPMPKLGGHCERGLTLAAYADGHVEVLSDQMDQKILHALFTVAGGETIWPPPAPPPPAAPAGPAPVGPAPKPPAPAAASGPSGTNRPKIEFRLAETEAGEGLVEADVPDRQEKIFLHSEAELNSDDVMGASVTTDNSGQSVISVAFTANGAKKMETVSKQNLHKKLAIFFDGKVIMAPTIQSEMSGGVQIVGRFSKEEAERIATGLNGK